MGFALFWTRPHYGVHLAPLAPWADGLADTVVVASWNDQRLASQMGRVVVMEHGIGQSYGNGHPSYPGGRGRGDAILFLTPNEWSARLWRQAYPHIPAVAIGSPRLELLPQRQPDGDGPVVAISFHWPSLAANPWSGSAFPDFRSALRPLADRFRLIGHAHPRALAMLAPLYRRLGIEVVADFDEVCRRADVYVADNTSTLYEFASTGRPVVVLNARRWDRSTGPGLRFWDAAGVGINVSDPVRLPDAVDQALADPGDVRLAREHALDIVYAYRTGAAQRAVGAIAEVAGVAA